MGSGSVDIWVSSTSFHKSNIGWHQQPLTERVSKIQYNISWFYPIFFFKTSKWCWVQEPQWPLWPQWPWQPHFIKKFTQHDGWIITRAQMTNTKFFTDIWYSFCRRLLMPAYVTCLKTLMKLKNPHLLNPLYIIIQYI